MTIRFKRRGDGCLLLYAPSHSIEQVLAKLHVYFDDDGQIVRYDPDTIPDELQQLGISPRGEATATIKRTFTFLQRDLVDDECDEYTLAFAFAHLDTDDAGYFRIPARIFDCAKDVLIAKDVKLDYRLFCVGYERRTSVIKKIACILSDGEPEIIIAGDAENAIPLEAYQQLLNRFPTTTNLERYGEALISEYIQEYLEPREDYGVRYRNSQRRTNATTMDFALGSPSLDSDRIVLLRAAYDQLSELLERGESVPEEVWQQGILRILPVLFPQYVAVIPKARIEDRLASTHREIDFLLIDASGNADVLEIKKAFSESSLLRRTPYRDNMIPARELSGSVMQIEKYIHLLMIWGQDGERELTRRHSSLLPPEMGIKFVNPRGLLLMGNCEFVDGERRDFDLIRRQYAHIADIITYPDLLLRPKRMMAAIEEE